MIVAKAGQYPDSLQGYGHVPGVRGGAIGSGAQIVSKLTYRGTKYLASRFFKPKKFTYAGATGRGIGAGTLIAGLLDSDVDDLDGTFQPPVKQTPNRFQQGNRRFRSGYRNRRCYNRHKHSDCCK